MHLGFQNMLRKFNCNEIFNVNNSHFAAPRLDFAPFCFTLYLFQIRFMIYDITTRPTLPYSFWVLLYLQVKQQNHKKLNTKNEFEKMYTRSNRGAAKFKFS